MSKDEKLLQHVFRLFDPLVRDEWTVDAANRTTFFFDNGASVYLKKSEFTVDRPAPTVLTMTLKRMARRRTGDGSYSWRMLDGGMCLHLDDGSSRVRICSSDLDDQKPVVMFRLNQDTLNGKELSFNVI